MQPVLTNSFTKSFNIEVGAKGFEMTDCQDFMFDMGHLAGPYTNWENDLWLQQDI